MIDYSYLRLHQTVLRSVADKTYLGLGYDLDYYWNVHEEDLPAGKVTDFQKYGFTHTSVSSGISVNALFDDRLNTINPENGVYAAIAYRPHYRFMGSDANWASLQGDFRKYFKLPGRRRQVIALWNYDWLTFGGTPYLQLPSTGWDAFVNTGRGYIQGRYRSNNMLYLEAEYRVDITRNGLLGAVAFANAESFSEPYTNKFQVVAPGAGAGIRFKLNKYSGTNVAIDYAFGLNGSRGFFVNLGEVF
jgi:outer membrane translocation and assembly module TamA